MTITLVVVLASFAIVTASFAHRLSRYVADANRAGSLETSRIESAVNLDPQRDQAAVGAPSEPQIELEQPGRPSPMNPLARAYSSPAGPKHLTSDAYLRLPINFEAVDHVSQPDVKFKARGHGYSMSFTKTGMEVLLRNPDSTRNGKAELARNLDAKLDRSSLSRPPVSIKMKLARPDARAHLSGLDELPGTTNYFIGNDPKKWQTNIANYSRLKYAGIYPGVDLLFYGNQRQIEYDFIISPGHDPRVIGLNFEGAKGLSVDGEGDLIIKSSGGQLRQQRPIAYQELDGSRKAVAVKYILTSPKTVGFAVEDYDREKPLVIDPILVYSTFLGGSDGEGATAISVDTEGNAYVTGWTYSLDFPTTTGAYQKTHGGGQRDIFISKINYAGTAMVYSTYLGGSTYDHPYGISVDPSGKASVVGVTLSANFPITPGAIQPTFRGANDAFVTKLNETGSALEYSTFLGGPSLAYGVATDSGGNTYVTGAGGADFPVTPGAFQTSPGGPPDPDDPDIGDAFVTKINAGGTTLIYSTFLGGPFGDSGASIAVDAAGSAYVTGTTSSPDFPLKNPYQSLRGGSPTIPSTDSFISKLSAAGDALVYSTYLGGKSLDQGFAIGVDQSGNAVVTGETNSTDFPTSSGALRTTLGGPKDAFVTRLTSGGQLSYSTYLGGSGEDVAHGLAVNQSSGAALIIGDTMSVNFPTTSNAFQQTTPSIPQDPRRDAFVTELSDTGSLVYSTYFGGSNNDHGAGIAADSLGNILLAGDSDSAQGATVYFPTKGDLQTFYGGGALDAFVAKLGDAVNNPTPTPTPTPVVVPKGNGKIAFVSIRSSQETHIYVMNADGTNQIQLTDQSDGSPTWSPDGTRLAFIRSTPNGTSLVVVNADGTNPVTLTSSVRGDFYPAWSPDGSQLAFQRDNQIYVIKADGTGLRRVTFTGHFETAPSWSPDGTRIAFSSSRSVQNGIYIVELDGSNTRRLTTNIANESWPAWSPDGTKMAFALDREIYVINVDGTNQTRLTQSVGVDDRKPAWSPDGKKIAFSRGSSSLWTMNSDGSNQVQLSNQSDFYPAWQPIAVSGPNPISDSQFFVSQHYRDFLNREPDSVGLAHWTSEITDCNDPAKRQPGESAASCTERKRSNTSAAFFLSPEFQNTGSFVVRVHWGTLGKQLGANCPSLPSGLSGQCRPLYSDYIADVSQVANGIVVNDQLDPNVINANKQAFVNQFVNTAAFKAKYDGLGNQVFVDTLFQTTGINASASDRSALVSGLDGGTETRASVVFKVVDGTTTQAGAALVFNTTYGKAFYDKEFDYAFVFMEYIGYLRRNPDQAGYDYWLNKLKFYGNWSDAQMVLAFISSPEYRARFGQP